jgi:Zn-dependent metalloprotease
MCVGHHRNPLHCILPPFVLKKMAESPDAKVRRVAIDSLGTSGAMRAMRSTLAMAPMLSAIPSAAQGKDRRIHTLKNRPPNPFNLPGKLVRSEGQGKSKDSAVNEAYDFSGNTYDFYKAVFQRNSLDNKGMSLISTVHVDRNFNNAFWNGEQMAYGDGDGVVFRRFTSSLDVVGHELSHGVVTHTSNLEYQDQPGALNEHFADVMGSLITQWRKKQTAKQASWLIGEELVVPASTRKALRSMSDPGTAFVNDPHLGSDPQPKHMDDFYDGAEDNGGVHVNSGIPNHVFYLVATELGGRAWEKAGAIWYKTLLKLNTLSQFQECADTTYQVAGTDHGTAEAQVLRKAWQKVGIKV